MGQNVTIRDASRIDLGSLTFYLRNLAREPVRYGTLPASAALILPAVALLVHRIGRHKRREDVLLAATLAVPLLVLALSDATKAPLYGAALLPALCMVVAMAASATADWRYRLRSRTAAVLTALAIVIGLAIVADGAAAYRLDGQEAAAATRYADVSSRLRAVIPDDSPVFGPHRWWWALHDRPYRALHGVWWQWRLARQAGEPSTFAILVHRAGARAIIVNDDVRGDVRRLPAPMPDEFWRFIETECRLAAAWRDDTYHAIEVYEVVSQ